MDKIVLDEVKETLFTPLFGKAKENQNDSPILIDRKAAEIISQIDYNFSSLKIPKETNMIMCLRAKLIDNYVKKFLKGNFESVALHLGCGLDSRYDRIGNGDVDWYDILNRFNFRSQFTLHCRSFHAKLTPIFSRWSHNPRYLKACLSH